MLSVLYGKIIRFLAKATNIANVIVLWEMGTVPKFFATLVAAGRTSESDTTETIA